MQSTPLDAGASPVARAPSPATSRKSTAAVDPFTAPWRRPEAWAAGGGDTPARVRVAEPSPGPSRASSPGVDDAFTLLDGASGWTTAASRSPSPSPAPSPSSRAGSPRARRALDRLPTVDAVLAESGRARSPSVADSEDGATVYGSGDEMLDDVDGAADVAERSEDDATRSASDAEPDRGPAVCPKDVSRDLSASTSRLGAPVFVFTGLALGVSLVIAYRASSSRVPDAEAAAWGRRRAADVAHHLWGPSGRHVAAAQGLWPRLRLATAGLGREASRAYAKVPNAAAAYAGMRHRLGPAHGAVAHSAANLRAGLRGAARRLADAAAQG